jgi:hypothetical protein
MEESSEESSAISKLSEHVSLSMFQCIVELSKDFTDSSYNLLKYWIHLYDISQKSDAQKISITDDNRPLDTIDTVEISKVIVKAFEPGSLGTTINCYNGDKASIGSLSVKFTLKHIDYAIDEINLSVLLFKKGKVKISGGLGKIPFGDNLTDDFLNILLNNLIIQPVFCICFGITQLPVYCMQKKMINANMRRPTVIGKERYLDFIQDIIRVFGTHRVILPEIMQINGKKRGRICAVKVKNIVGKKGSFAVDHSGNVQFFAFNNIDELKGHALDLFKIWL